MNERATAAGRTILCIDDNSDVLQAEKAILERAGFAVLLASSGAEGLHLAKNHAVDLVVLDWEMPGITGPEAAWLLRATQPTLPIIMVSGTDHSESSKGIADCFVQKNHLTTLVRKANRLLGNRRGGRE
jgi:DNA-binding response OmpR family regulator